MSDPNKQLRVVASFATADKTFRIVVATKSGLTRHVDLTRAQAAALLGTLAEAIGSGQLDTPHP